MCVSFCHAQPQLDSLKRLLYKAQVDDRLKNEMYQAYQVALYFYKQNEFDSSVHYYNLMLKKSPNDATSASALNGLGMVHSAMGFTDRSILFYTDAIRLFEGLKDTTNAVTAGYNLAIIYADKGLYDNALEISFNTLSKLEGQKPGRPLASSYNTIGMVYAKIGDYAKSYDYYRKALKVRLSIGYDLGVGQSYNNLGELFILMRQYDSALLNLRKSIDFRTKINDMRGLGRTLNLVGNTLLQSGKPHEAKDQLLQAVAINRSTNDNIAEISTLNNLAATALTLREFKSAEDNLGAAEKLIQKTRTQDDLRRTLELRTDLYRRTGNQSKLITTLDRLQLVKDSLLNAEKVENLLNLEIQYETEKKEQEIISLQQRSQIDQARLDLSRNLNNFLGVVVVLTVVILVLLYRLYRLSRKARETAELNTREIHHRTTNNLQMLISFFTIQGSLVGDQKTAELLKSTEGRVNAMVLIHKKLYMSEKAAALDLRDYIPELIQYLAFSYGFETRLRTEISIDKIDVVSDKAIPIGLILNELISNSFKYAYGAQNEPHLNVRVSRNETSIVIGLNDNGTTTFSFKDADILPSFGLRMVRSLVQELHGTIASKANNGTEYLITIPF
jgi:two-component sensor histidine kinase